jgi:hypothetical protein
MNRAAIIEKIKKLLRMKRGGTPDEVATALRLAQELAARHGIDIAGVNPDEEAAKEKPVTHADEMIGARCSWESKYAALVANQFFKVSVFRDLNADLTKYIFRFIGEEWDIQIAIYVYRFLCGHFRREWRTRRGRCRNRQAFMYGMYLGLCGKLRDRQPLTEQKPGIIPVDQALARRNEYIAFHFGDLSSSSVEPDGDAATAKYRGWVAGRETEIRSGVAGTPPQTPRPMLQPPVGQLQLV